MGEEKKPLISFMEPGEQLFIPVDDWSPQSPDEIIINVQKGHLIAPISATYNLNINPEVKFDWFVLSTKKCYNSNDMRAHLYQYINYFEVYYDKDREYLAVLYHIKTIMDKYDENAYNQNTFFNDLYRYILKSNLATKVMKMVEDNYMLALNYVNARSPSLQYTDYHAKILLCMSILMDLCIPLLTNYAYMHRVDNIDDYLMSFFDAVLYLYDIDMYSKLADTAYTNIHTNQKTNQGVWDKQDIRGIDITTHTDHSVRNIILNIMPKYQFNKNIISLNTASIRQNTKYQVTDIGFEFSYVPVSSSKRDEDSVSDFDRFEANLIQQNESLYMQNKINYQCTIDTIEAQFGPFDKHEIDIYLNQVLKNDRGEPTINGFQKTLVFDMFYKYFRDVQSIRAINRKEYAELIIAAKHILVNKNMKLLPYIISGRVDKLVLRKNVNKRELLMIESSPTYQKVLDKYQNADIAKHIRSIVATIISSDFSIIDPDPEINGRHIDIVTPIIIEEVLIYVLIC